MVRTSPPPAARISAPAASSTSRRRAQIATRAPSSASAVAAALPIPSLPPVTMATLPLSPKSMILPFALLPACVFAIV